MSQPQSLPPIENWLSTALELISFPANPAEAMEQNWWPALVGTDCAESVRKRGERIDKGEFDGRTLQLAIDPLRVRWVVSPAGDFTDQIHARPPSIGLFPETRDHFGTLMERWLESMCPPLSRLAFAARLMLPCEDREHSYRLLDRYLDSVRLDPQSTDFQYRINRKRPTATGIPNLIINRLNTWSAVRVELTTIAISSSAATAQTSPKVFEGCMLQLDMNTDHQFTGELPHDRLTDIWQELVGFATEIAACGDIP